MAWTEDVKYHKTLTQLLHNGIILAFERAKHLRSNCKVETKHLLDQIIKLKCCIKCNASKWCHV